MFRFDISLSFPGEYRTFIEEVAGHLADAFGKEHILYDRFHDAELSRVDAGIYLPNLYAKHSRLIVVFLCPGYELKSWCLLEWRHIRQLIATQDTERVMFFSFSDPGDLSELGILSDVGYIDITQRSLTTAEVSGKIQDRLKRNHKINYKPDKTQNAQEASPKEIWSLQQNQNKEDTEEKTINYLKKQDTNYVFTFGAVGTGKTAMTASLLRIMRHEESKGDLKISTEPPYHYGAKLFSDFEAYFARGNFPIRTCVGETIAINGIFTPFNKRLPELNITFLEMSGEDLSSISNSYGQQPGYLPERINVYLKASLPIMFILVTPWHNATDNDRLLSDFITHIRHFMPIDNRLLLLISMWDTSPHKNESIDSFAKRTMPTTYRLLNQSKNNATIEYSVGSVLYDTDMRQQFIEHFYTKYPFQLWRHIYKTFTKKDITKETLLARLWP